MQKINIKSVILGIGIGFIISSFISIIFIAGQKPGANITNAEIIERAKKLGMVESTSLISPNNTAQPNNTEEQQNGNGQPNENDTEQPAENGAEQPAENTTEGQAPVENAQPETVSISIIRGDTSEVVASKFYHAGLVEDERAFAIKIEEMGKSRSINYGTFTFVKGIDVDSIIRRIIRSY